MSGASDYRPPASVGPRLSVDQHKALMSRLVDPFQPVRDDVERRWLEARDIDARWMAHAAVRVCGIACVQIGLTTLDIERAVREQRDTMLRDLNEALSPRDPMKAAELIAFLCHRGVAPSHIETKIVKASSLDAATNTYCAIKALAAFTIKEPLNPVDVHEAVRQWRDRWSSTTGERRVWTPDSYR